MFTGSATWPMRVGVDDAGRRQTIYQDAVMRKAFEALGFDLLMHHLDGPARVEDVAALAGWAAETGHDFILNQECADRPAAPSGPESPYRKGGCFFQPSRPFVDACLASPRFLGICYDEAEHWTTNGVWVTGQQHKGFRPHLYDASGDDLPTAYEGNLHNWRVLLERHYSRFSSASTAGRPIIATEHVFPIMHHLFARAGLTPIPKYMKETMQPVAAAMTLGAARQYGCDYWACLDLWGIQPGYPGHPVQDLESALLFAHWTGASTAYIENFNFRGSLYSSTRRGGFELSPHGQVSRRFIREYLPANGRPKEISARNFRPRIVILRFEDTDWGQYPRGGYISGTLYGAANLWPDEQTRYWIKIWHVLTHGQTPLAGLTWHADFQMPYRFFFPANSVAVYDHLAGDPALFDGTRLVFLTGKLISPQTYAILHRLVGQGLVVVTAPHLAPAEIIKPGAALTGPYLEVHAGGGAWLATDDVTRGQVRQRLAPYLGRPDELTFAFGHTEVVFRDGGPERAISVELRPAGA